MKLTKLLRHLTNTPVAIALAFLLVGAPGAPIAKFIPSSSEAHAIGSGDDGRAPWEPPPDCNDPSNFNECYGTILPVLAVIAGAVAFVGGVLAIIDSCRTGSCAEFIDWVEREFEEQSRVSEERLNEWCSKTKSPVYLCDGRR